MDENSSPASPKGNISCREQAGMFQIILNRPPHNSLSLEMVEEINAALASIAYRNDLKVIVLSTHRVLRKTLPAIARAELAPALHCSGSCGRRRS